jgi:hypothetical protein
MEDTYSFGICKRCLKERPLKNDWCAECNQKPDMDIMETFNQLFGGGRSGQATA